MDIIGPSSLKKSSFKVKLRGGSPLVHFISFRPLAWAATGFHLADAQFSFLMRFNSSSD